MLDILKILPPHVRIRFIHQNISIWKNDKKWCSTGLVSEIRSLFVETDDCFFCSFHLKLYNSWHRFLLQTIRTSICDFYNTFFSHFILVTVRRQGQCKTKSKLGRHTQFFSVDIVHHKKMQSQFNQHIFNRCWVPNWQLGSPK